MRVLSLLRESEHCLLCFDPPCSQNCPSQIRPADIIRSICFDNMQLAYASAQGCLLCGQCELYCTRAKLDSAVHITDIMTCLKEGEK